MSIYKSDNGWVIKGTIYYNNKRQYYTRTQNDKGEYFKTKKEAQEFEWILRDKLKNKLAIDYNSIYFQNFFDEFLSYKKTKIASSYFENSYKYSFTKNISSIFIMSNSISKELTQKRYQQFYDYIKNNNYSTKWKNKVLKQLKDMTEFARNRHYITADEKDDLLVILEPIKISPSEVYKETLKQKNYTPLEDLPKIINECEEPYNYVFEIFYYSGCRISEFLAIECKDVTFKDGKAYISINKQVERVKGVINPDLKTSTSYRTIEFEENTAKLLKEYIEKYKFKDDDLIFNFSKTTFRRKLSEAIEKAGLPHNTLHEFGRKSISTELFNASLNPKVSQLHLGHKKPDITMSTYVNTSSAQKALSDTLEELENKK